MFARDLLWKRNPLSPISRFIEEQYLHPTLNILISGNIIRLISHRLQNMQFYLEPIFGPTVQLTHTPSAFKPNVQAYQAATVPFIFASLNAINTVIKSVDACDPSATGQSEIVGDNNLSNQKVVGNPC